MSTCVQVKYPLLQSDINETWVSPTDFSKNTQIPNFMKICQVEAELFHEDRQTDRHTDVANWRFP